MGTAFLPDHPELTLAEIDVRAAEAAELATLAAHEQIMEQECFPEDPITPTEEWIARWRSSPDFAEIACWAVRNAAGAIIADAWVEIWHTGANEHALWFNIQVQKEHRRQGIGRALFARVVAYTAGKGRTLLIADTIDRLPAGAVFLGKIGGEPGLPSKLRQLDAQSVDRDLLAAWQARGVLLAERYEIGFWDGPYPEADMEQIVTLHNVTWNIEPRGDLALEDEKLTAEHFRQMERAQAARGDVRWSCYVRERATGVFVGDTEVFWHPNRPERLWQGFTGVLPQHQKQGLGHWLKAEMLLRVLRERPGVRHIRVGNADVNAPMLRINEGLGYRLFSTNVTWQAPLDKARAYLQGPRGAAP
jgi:GNAT superfamily N-acetyltransferase